MTRSNNKELNLRIPPPDVNSKSIHGGYGTLVSLGMKRSCSPAILAGVFIGLLLMNVCALVSQNSAVEYQVKAAFLFNFAKFIDWPSQAFPRASDPFTICLAGDPFGSALEKTIQGETFNGRTLVIRRIAAGESLGGCQIVYVAVSEARRSMEIINAAANMPVLTVGETESFIRNGGMIRFTEAGHRIQFQINPDAAERASLRISSRLLRLADIVRSSERSAIR